MFKNKHLVVFGLLLTLGITAGCKSQFEKIRTSTDIGKKYQEGIRLYNKKSYSKALVLFDDLTQRYRGRAEAEDLAYYFAYTNYHLSDYTTARYQFKLFADTYPASPKAEECRYMAAYCFYLESPKYSLDQENTRKAIEALQLFINLYPKSTRVAEASKLIDDLRNKLEKKSYENAKLYLNIGDYKSAVIAFRNSLRDYPDTEYAEEMEYLSLEAQYLYARNSLETKQEERYNELISMHTEFEDKYAKSKYLKDAKNLRKQAEEGIAEVKKVLAAQNPAEKKEDQEKKETEDKQDNKISQNESN
jgi:outer membrane protein assembly factor BamD